MPDVVKVVLHISRRPRGGTWVVKAGAALTLALRFAVVGIGAWAVLERPEMSREAAGALAIGLVWCVAAPLLARPRALRSTVLLTDESLLYADDAAVLDWTDVRTHAVVGDQLLFEPTEEARRADRSLKNRYAVPLGPATREAVVEAFQSRPRARRDA